MKTTLKIKTKKEIYQDVVNLVQLQGGRAMDDGFCSYEASDGKICGHSMALTDEAREKLLNLRLRGSVASNVIEELGDTCHKPEYRGHSIVFWMRVQEFHDLHKYWNELELSEEGKLLIEEL
jgi:hypothetical protein